jgi:hypothetical protein
MVARRAAADTAAHRSRNTKTSRMFEPLYDDKPKEPSDDAAEAPPGRQPVAPALAGGDAGRALGVAPTLADDRSRSDGPAASADRAHIQPAGARGRPTSLPAFDGQ